MEQTTYQLASDLRVVITRLIKKLRVKSETGAMLSLTERSTLALLDQHQQLLPGELASMEKITTQSMSQILNKLADAGYISRKIAKDDKRKSIISLTKAGQDTLYKVRNEREEWLNKALEEVCSEKEKIILRNAIEPLKKLVDYE
ncbi:MAG: MarR family transcriptional regulator [Ginsengibacter sp.]